MKDRETRTVTVGKLELRASDKGNMLVGYAAKFNTMSDDLGGFLETIAPGAFSRAIKEKHDVRALFNHDPNYVLGRTKSGTLTLREDGTGLEMCCAMPDTQTARDLMESVKRGDIDQQSFSFRCLSDSWAMRDGMSVRTLQDLELFDVSPVTYPAYQDTSVASRSLDAHKKTLVVIAPDVMRKAKLMLAKAKI